MLVLFAAHVETPPQTMSSQQVIPESFWQPRRLARAGLWLGPGSIPIIAVLLMMVGFASRWGMHVPPDLVAAAAIVAIGVGHTFSLIVLLAIVSEVAYRPRATGAIALAAYWLLLAVGCIAALCWSGN